ncbi:MAG: transglutaminase N-terminal domain-containing protein [Verrucomicrobiota bacterium]
MKWEIIHRTEYKYAAPVRDSFNEARLQPFSDEWQKVDHFLLKILPAARLRHHHDFYSKWWRITSKSPNRTRHCWSKASCT